MSDKTQVHEIYFMAEDENKKMVMLEDYIESLADIHKLKKRITELEAQLKERDELAATVERMRDSLDELQANSVGVIGLHMNGDIATWDSLRQGGHFESWLIAFDETPQQNLNAIKREATREAYLQGLWDANGRYMDGYSRTDMCEEYLNKLYPSDKDGER